VPNILANILGAEYSGEYSEFSTVGDSWRALGAEYSGERSKVKLKLRLKLNCERLKLKLKLKLKLILTTPRAEIELRTVLLAETSNCATTCLAADGASRRLVVSHPNSKWLEPARSLCAVLPPSIGATSRSNPSGAHPATNRPEQRVPSR